ncbi:MAG TPA: hypothetical protein VIM53_02420 [Candidatus Saccharimonadales bacterium]
MATSIEEWPLGSSDRLSEQLRRKAAQIEGEKRIRETLIPQHRALSERAAALATRFAIEGSHPAQTPWVEVARVGESIFPPSRRVSSWYALKVTGMSNDQELITDLLEKQTLPHPLDPNAEPLEAQTSRVCFGSHLTYEAQDAEVEAPGVYVKPHYPSEDGEHPRAATEFVFKDAATTLDSLEAKLAEMAEATAAQQPAA